MISRLRSRSRSGGIGFVHCSSLVQRVDNPQRVLRVSQSFHGSPGGWRGFFPAGLLLAGLILGARLSAGAHDVLGTYIQHAVQLTVGARYIDVTLDLTFFEEWSASERKLMDADANGNITRAERADYLRKLAPQVAQQVKLRVAGRELPLVPLYDPEIDLLGSEQVGPAHHRLRLCFFAPTPAGMRAGAEFLIEDRLWPDAKALGTPQAEGRDGCRMTTEIFVETGLTPTRLDDAQRFNFRCVTPPAKVAPQKTSPFGTAGKVSKFSPSSEQSKSPANRTDL